MAINWLLLLQCADGERQPVSAAGLPLTLDTKESVDIPDQTCCSKPFIPLS